MAAAVFRGAASAMISLLNVREHGSARSLFCIDATKVTLDTSGWFRSTVSSNRLLPSKIGKYCFGFAILESGHNLDPTPPDNNTLIILLMINRFLNCFLLDLSSGTALP